MEKYDQIIEKILSKKRVYRIINNKKINIENLIKIINADEKMQKYNEEIQKEINEIKEYNSKNLIEEKNNKKEKIKNKNLSNKKIIKKEKRKNNNLTNKKTIKNEKNIIINVKKYLIKIIKKIKQKLIYYFENKKNNVFSINKKNEKNIITILGNDGSGKSIFSALFSIGLMKYYNKILILDFDFTNKSIHSIFGVKSFFNKKNQNKNYQKIINENNFNINNYIIKINKKIDIISNIDSIFNGFNKINYEKINELLQDLIKKYDVIIIDTGASYLCEKNKKLINLSDFCVFLTEANLIQLTKTKKILDYYFNKLNIPQNKIKIIFNKYNKFCIKNYLLKKLYFDYQILGFINYSKKINFLINYNFKNYFLEKNIAKKIKKIIIKLFI